MSKYVKELVTRDIKRRLEGVEDAVVVSCVGMDANTTNELRGELEKKDIHMLVVKNTLARRATEGSQIHGAFEGAAGQVSVCWGASDFVSLVKEIVKLDKDKEKYEKFVAGGGVMDGEKLDAEGLKAVSKWPNREEQISMLVGQILGPGSQLSAALLGPGKMLNSQIKKKGEGDE
ncbi:50S ribosomal protein L10 [Rubripirellula amarantea]|uniref:Large ribosomal subunit protein uL10 n=1 Tax=Rubripirellula amarantea TaxID=2527999 RepID=A0A5C5WFE0_9BACT|nr:50S ribosomal protein L10 [Rubripirellula amarantea]MDA8743209.1 50S ribosomal protein L10 [Rubripirellula amarantea]TWT49474.1 50S ribosomal protein L10 [Rubripirellula amarantea]